MVDMMNTDFKPGDIVQHPEHGYGVVLKNFPGVPTIYFAGEHGYENTTRRFTGWERVVLKNFPDVPNLLDACAALDEESSVEGKLGTSLIRHLLDGRDLTEYDDLDPQTLSEWPPADEKPTSTTVTLPCPDCGEAITRTAQVWTGSRRDRTLTWVTLGWHTCPPAQPDEPTEFGARIVVTDDLSGKAERWCRQHDGDWANADDGLATWAYLTQRGTVTLGWDE